MASSIPAVLLLLLLLLLLSLAKLPRTQAQSNITLGSSLTAEDGSSSWKSPSGDFAFGFQKVGSRTFLLAIWFENIPEKTVIWWANGVNLALQGSKVELTERGLNLSNPDGVKIWPQVEVSGVNNAYMLDTGNFVLVDKAGNELWETFRHPSDTILPTQVLDLETSIVSRNSATSYSSGRFTFRMQADGNLVMHTLPIIDSSNTYWATSTVGSGYQVIFNQTGEIYLTSRNGTIIRTITSETVSSRDFYQRAVIDHDGVFRQYVYPKNARSISGRVPGWSTISSPVPPNICTSMRVSIGAGACGLNSYCILRDDQRPRCECPHGYSYIDPSNEMDGCKRDFLPQSCDKGIYYC